MKKTIVNLTLLVLLIFTFQVNAQTEYPTKNVNGVDYFLYTVQQSEGLFAISRRFDVTQAEINTLNPEIHNGLQVGQQILVPISDSMKQKIEQKTKTSENKIAEKKVDKKQDFVEHEVLRRQTLFAISRLYNVEQDEIIKLNPEIENKRLKTGMVLRIPVQIKVVEIDKKIENLNNTNNSNSSTQSASTRYLTHNVIAGDTFYSLSNLYNVSIDEISKLNNITDGKLKIGYELKIPNTKKEIKNTTEKVVENTHLEISDNIKSVDTNQTQTIIKLNEGLKPNKKPLRIAFLLPFMLDASKKATSVERFQDFYAGALLAINQAKSKGVSLEILTLDTENTDNSIISVLQNENLKKVDLIIGPAYTDQIAYVSEYARKNKIHTLIPFSSNVNDVQTNKYLFQFNPDVNVQANFLKNTLQNKYKDQEIVFINLDEVSFLDSGNELSIALRNLLDIQKRKYKIIKLNRNDQTDLNKAINQNKKNIVFFNTDKFSTVSPYLGMLDSINTNSSIILYEQYGWIQNKTENLSTFSISPFKSIVKNEAYNNYKANFNKYFGWQVSKEQPYFDILGYDLTSYFISMLYSFEGKFTVDPITHLLPQSMGIQSDLMFFKQNNESGFKNHTLFLNENFSIK